MILPASYPSVLLLLIASLICLGSWVNTFKAAGARWRFELFSIDFSVGAMLLVLFVAFTLGTLGSDLGFSDRMLVAGRTAQGLALVAGAVFNLGNMLLLAAVSLLGITTAFPLSVGVALIVGSCFHLRSGNLAYLIAGIVVMMAAVLFEVCSARLRDAAAAAKKHSASTARVESPAAAKEPLAAGRVRAPETRTAKPTIRPAAKPKARKSARGIIAAIISGIALGCFPLVLQNCVPGDLGLGAYAAMLLFGVGVLVSTLVYNFYFLNISIEGSPLTFGAYFKGGLRQHLLGFIGGVLCAGGILAALLAAGAPAAADVPPILNVVFPLVSVPLAFFFGAAVWKEFAGARSNVKTSLIAGIALFACSLGLLAFGFAH
jgi:glucose uptake protein